MSFEFEEACGAMPRNAARMRLSGILGDTGRLGLGEAGNKFVGCEGQWLILKHISRMSVW